MMKLQAGQQVLCSIGVPAPYKPSRRGRSTPSQSGQLTMMPSPTGEGIIAFSGEGSSRCQSRASTARVTAAMVCGAQGGNRTHDLRITSALKVVMAGVARYLFIQLTGTFRWTVMPIRVVRSRLFVINP